MSGTFLKQKFQWSMSLFKMAHNILQILEGGDFEAQKLKLTQMFNRSKNVHITTKTPLLGMCCYALFFMGIHKSIAVLIPKKNGKGYLKSPFGGHHCNKKYFEFCQLNLKYSGTCVDIDGYLSVGFGVSSWDKKEYEEGIKEVMEGLVSIFPQCKGYKEVDSPTFWSHVK
jgi:hypothetical protein